MFSWSVLHGVRIAVRSLLKTPALTFVVLTLRGNGGNQSLGSLLDGVREVVRLGLQPQDCEHGGCVDHHYFDIAS